MPANRSSSTKCPSRMWSIGWRKNNGTECSSTSRSTPGCVLSADRKTTVPFDSPVSSLRMSRPVFAFLAFTSGSYEGAIIRDMRLANALHRRGYKVVVYWMMERNADLVDKGITQRLLVSGMRYQFAKPCGLMERLGRMLMVFPPQIRREFMQRHPDYVDRLMTNFCRVICAGGEADGRIVSRLIRFMKKDGVTHLLPTFAMNAPFALAAKARRKHSLDRK